MFKNTEARQRQEKWYNRFLERTNCEVTSKTVQTSFGSSHILLAGDSSKPPLVCLHAMLTGSAHLLSEIEDLTQSYYLILPDIPGHSVRGIPKQLSYKDDSYSKWFLEVINAVGLKEFNLFGISLGGFVAHRFTAIHSEMVDKLALVVPAGIVQASVLKGLMSMAIPMMKYRFNPSEENLKNLTEFLLNNWDEDWGPYLGDSMQDFKTPKSIPSLSSDETLQKINMPCLVIGADQDISFPGEPMIKRVKSQIPNVETELLKDTRHSPPTTDEFRRWMVNRLERFYG